MLLFLLTSLAYLLGCTCSYFLQGIWGLSAITSIALTGFAGACSGQIVENFHHLLILSFIGSVVFYVAIPYLVGFGGRLGTISFISSLIFFLAKTAW